jgi:hypothetical protein
MIPGGYGFEVLQFDESSPERSIRNISQLPADVRIVSALSDLPERHGFPGPRDWIHPGPLLRPLYILICHRYCGRVSPGMAYMFTRLGDFLERYRQLQEDEKKPLEPPDPYNQMMREAWHMDEDGVAREYVWHDTGGWVPKWTKEYASVPGKTPHP